MRKLFVFKSALTIFLISIICLICSGCGDKSKSNDNIKEKREFADVALSVLKSAEIMYVDQMAEGNQKYTLYDIKEYIGSSVSGLDGCVVIEADNDGSINNKYIYITDEKYMIINKSSSKIGSEYENIVKNYTSSEWDEDYKYCDL